MKKAFERSELLQATGSAFEHALSVRFQDVDAAGVVFFARFFDYVHAAYEQFLAHAGHPLPEVLRDRTWVAPLVHAEADYLHPVGYGDHLTISLVGASSKGSVLTLGWRLQKQGAQSSVCVVQTVHCFLNAADFSRIEIPQAILAAVASVATDKTGD